LKVGATWQGSQIGVEVSAQETVNTPAGIFQNCFRVDVRVLDESDFYSVWFAKDVGPVKVAEINSADKGIEDVFVLHSFNVR
jgi:hypothetical protein